MAKGDIKRRREIERLSASLPSLTTEQEKEAQQVRGTAWIGRLWQLWMIRRLRYC